MSQSDDTLNQSLQFLCGVGPTVWPRAFIEYIAQITIGVLVLCRQQLFQSLTPARLAGRPRQNLHILLHIFLQRIR